MVWLSKWILSHSDDARVLIVTDRDELDEQMERTYKGVNEKIVRTKSCDDLLRRLNAYDDSLLCSLVQKFGRRGGEAAEADYDKYIDELKKALPSGFEAKRKIYVFVDGENISFDDPESGSQMEDLISELTEFYGLSKQATKTRMSELGFHCVENVPGKASDHFWKLERRSRQDKNHSGSNS